MISNFLQKTPPFKGKFRLVRFFLGRYLKKLNDIEINGKFGIAYKIPNTFESIGFELFVNGIYESEYIQLILKNIPMNGVFLDLGANIGSICIPIAKLRPDVTIYAIEASPRVFSYLKYNVEKNGCTNIIIENRALSVDNDKIVSFYSPQQLFGKGSLIPAFTTTAELVKTSTLDAFVDRYRISRVDFIKMNVEGFEKTVLSSGIKLLSEAYSPKILFEFSDYMEAEVENYQPGDCQRFLFDLGYQLYNLSNPKKPVFLDSPLENGTHMILSQKHS